VLFIVSVATIGLSENLDYVLRILPAHAISEVGSDAQLSFSVILYAMGAGVSAAIAMGTVSYVLACTLGIALGGALAKRFGSQGFIIVTPAAMSLIGGSFIHVTQMAAALPFVLLLWTAAPRYRAAILPALLLLAVPWRIVGSPLLMTVAATVVLYLAWEMSARNARVSLAAGAGAVMCMLALNVWMAAPPMQSRAVAHYASRIDNTYAEASWARYNEEYLSTGAPERWWRRAPTWFGLLLIGGSAIAATTRRDNRPAVLQAAADA
jgi:hypothetical protein